MVIGRILPLVLLLSLTLFPLGCRSTHKWVGHYRGEQEELVPESVEDDVIANTLRMVDLTINEDMTFSLLRAGFPYEGNVIVGDKACKLKVTSVLGRPIENENKNYQEQNSKLTIVWIDEQTLKLIDDADFGRDPVILTRKNPSY